MKKEAMFYEKLDNKQVRCYLCAHRCRIANSRFGICGVRQNEEGTLYTLVYARVAAANIDPIEKKPLYHFLPGTSSYSIGTVGCNFQCGFCQNWQVSQVSASHDPFSIGCELLPQEVVKEAKKNNCSSVSYTYTEPTIFFEYAYDTARLALEAGLRNVLVTNGYMTKQAVDAIRPYIDAANIDFKSSHEDYYRKNCKAHLQPVLNCIAYMKQLDIWVEVTTLIIPGENDSDEELGEISHFIAQLDKNIPWHVTRFQPGYQFIEYPPTPTSSLVRAKEIGRKEGLRYVYILEDSDTCCFNCGELLVKRVYLGSETINLINGRCPSCGVKIRGVWQ
jgi:pyruvate formate lyase activating enzyme